MDSSTNKSCRPEIAAPAGSLEKLKIAVKFGADSVYFGADRFNLRAGSAHLGPDEIAAAAAFCRSRGVKSTLLLNSFLHEGDIDDARYHIRTLAAADVDAIMVSDPGMLFMLREMGAVQDLHLSTQMSTLNRYAVKFWADAGISRIVLARETTLDEIRSIREHTDAELEIFVHGALCISYSGRCLLSRYLSGRDANQGQCAHPCRWNYTLMEEKRPGNHLPIIEYDGGTEILSSKDLCLIGKISDYAAAGVHAFKIEGRMKSLYYAANTTRIYRHAVEVWRSGADAGPYIDFWQSELDLVSHRPYTDDLFNEYGPGGFGPVPYISKALFLGYRTDDAPGPTDSIIMKTANPVYRNETIEAIQPIPASGITDDRYTVKEILADDKSVDMAEQNRLYTIKLDKPLTGDAIFRRRITEK